MNGPSHAKNAKGAKNCRRKNGKVHVARSAVETARGREVTAEDTEKAWSVQ